MSDKCGPEHSGSQPEENGPDALSGNVEGEASCEKSMNQEVSGQSVASAVSSVANDEPQLRPYPEPSGLATPEESSTRTSALQETDDSDDDPVLIPGARYRGGPGHRSGKYFSLLFLSKVLSPPLLFFLRKELETYTLYPHLK